LAVSVPHSRLTSQSRRGSVLVVRLNHAMKRCSYCGAEYSDELNECPIDHASVVPSVTPTREANNEKHKQAVSSGKRIGLRILGIILIVLAIGSYIGGVHDFENGDIDFRAGETYRGVKTVSNMAFRLTLVLGVAGVICLGCSFPSGQDKNKNDKDSA